jgi:hypothetical protein
MFTVIATAMLKSLTSYLFGGYLKAHYGSVEIDGAPSWYGQEPKEAICVSTYRNGGLSQLDDTKRDAKILLNRKVGHILEIVIYQNFQNLKPDEEAFLNSIKKDKKLSLFVDANTRFQNIKVDNEKHKVFVRSCLDKEAFIKYEKKRVKELSKDLTFYKSDKAFDELDGKSHPKSGRDDKAFDELDSIDMN